jgi:esterase/lipase
MKRKFFNILLNIWFIFIFYSCIIVTPAIAKENSAFEIVRLMEYKEFFPPASNISYTNDELPHYWETSDKKPKGVIVVVHGLNVKPSKMGTPETEGTLVKFLLDSGYNVYRVTLTGHAGSIENMQNVTKSDWLSDAYIQYCEAKIAAERADLSIYLLGFSLGALVFESLMNENTATPVQFEKVILFSPAIAIKTNAKVILMLQPLTNNSSIINSVSPEEYRAQRGASMGAYKNVFSMEEKLRDVSFFKNNVDTIIFIDKNDEMISIGTLKNRIKQYNLTNWNVLEISNKGAVIKPQYHHLLIDNRCVSLATWQYITNSIIGFLE